MARIILEGDAARVELTVDQEEGGIIATCLDSVCTWTEQYDTLGDAAEYAGHDHADLILAHPGPASDPEGQ